MLVPLLLHLVKYHNNAKKQDLLSHFTDEETEAERSSSPQLTEVEPDGALRLPGLGCEETSSWVAHDLFYDFLKLT